MEESTLEKKGFSSSQGSLRNILTDKDGIWKKFPWKGLKDIRSLAKVETKCGSGDFHRMETILKNHGERWAKVENEKTKRYARALRLILFNERSTYANFEPDLKLDQYAIQML